MRFGKIIGKGNTAIVTKYGLFIFNTIFRRMLMDIQVRKNQQGSFLQ
jgi:hypothetical protein